MKIDRVTSSSIVSELTEFYDLLNLRNPGPLSNIDPIGQNPKDLRSRPVNTDKSVEASGLKSPHFETAPIGAKLPVDEVVLSGSSEPVNTSGSPHVIQDTLEISKQEMVRTGIQTTVENTSLFTKCGDSFKSLISLLFNE